MDLVLYFFVILTLTAIPGPGILLNIVIGLNNGLKATLISIIGMLGGLLILAFGSYFFLEILTKSHPFILSTIQSIGSLYLIYMGYNKIKSQKSPSLLKKKIKNNPKKFFLDGFFMSLSGPKPIIFFSTVVTQFIDFEKNYLEQYILLIAIFFALILLVNLLYTYLLIKISQKLKSFETVLPKINIFSGIFFMVLGLGFLYKLTIH